MPDLIIYIPFARDGAGRDGDIQRNARELEAVQGLTINNQAIQNIILVFRGEEDGQVENGDFVLVHGHGGNGNFTDVVDNLGGSITLANLLVELNNIDAQNAAAIFFFICFSSQQGHVADVFNAIFANISVFGTGDYAQGGVVTQTRSGTIRSSVFSSGQLQLL